MQKITPSESPQQHTHATLCRISTCCFHGCTAYRRYRLFLAFYGVDTPLRFLSVNKFPFCCLYLEALVGWVVVYTLLFGEH